MDAKDWAEFWSGDHAIYVNARHLEAHYARIVADLKALMLGRRNPVLLDWGCGDALGAPDLSKTGIELLLYDAVSAVQERLQKRFGAVGNLKVLNTTEFDSLPPGSIDAILVNSVAQYLSRSELEVLLDRFRVLLRPDGELLLGDIISPDISMIADIRALLGPGWQHGYFIAAVIGLARTFFSDYRTLRQRLGLTMYRQPEIEDMLRRHGFAPKRLPRNIGFNQARMLFRAALA